MAKRESVTLEEKAIDVVTAWRRWCDADGWDNAEYDELSEALLALELRLERTKKVPRVR